MEYQQVRPPYTAGWTAALWNTTFSLLGYLLAAEVDRLQMLIERAGWVLLGVLVLLFLTWRFVRGRIRQRIREERRAAQCRARIAALR